MFIPTKPHGLDQTPVTVPAIDLAPLCGIKSTESPFFTLAVFLLSIWL
jgi:hypothetical protein